MTIISPLHVIWLTVILAAIFIEALSERLIAVWLAPAAAVAFICGVFEVSVGKQIAVFAVLAVTMISVAKLICGVVNHRGKHNESDWDIK